MLVHDLPSPHPEQQQLSGLGDQNSANLCSSECRKGRLRRCLSGFSLLIGTPIALCARAANVQVRAVVFL